MSARLSLSLSAGEAFLSNENVLRHSLEYCDVVDMARMALTCSRMKGVVLLTVERCISHIERSYYHA
jgi:hypothetical protein